MRAGARRAGVRARGRVGGAGIGHLSSQGMSEVGVFSQITGTRSLYRSRTRADSAMRCSKECSRLCAKLIRIGLDGVAQQQMAWSSRPGNSSKVELRDGSFCVLTPLPEQPRNPRLLHTACLPRASLILSPRLNLPHIILRRPRAHGLALSRRSFNPS